MHHVIAPVIVALAVSISTPAVVPLLAGPTKGATSKSQRPRQGQTKRESASNSGSKRKSPRKTVGGSHARPGVAKEPTAPLPVHDLWPRKKIIEMAEDAKVVPIGGDAPLRTLATLTAAVPRHGDTFVEYRCADVHAGLGPHGEAIWTHRVLDRCRAWRLTPGVQVFFPVEAGKAYAVDCESVARTRWKVSHRIVVGEESTASWVTTPVPTAFVLATQDGQARVTFEHDPEDDHIVWQGVRRCRVSQVG